MSQEALKNVLDAVVEGEVEDVAEFTEKAVAAGVKPLDILNEGLVKGIEVVGERYATGDYFLPDLILGAKAMDAGIGIIEPLLTSEKREFLGRVLMGTVEGDLHDIGKNIVMMMLKSNGFEVFDLGVDVPSKVFVEKVKELKPQVIGISALLTTTVDKQKEIIELLQEEGLRDQVKVIIGGAPINQAWSEKIGADGYGEDALSAVGLCKNLLNVG
ncbi:MAG: cobalamin B12-binding domain-containing protein [Syntrophaceticus sp.]|jgi:corrinoid protein of di/trimethylamine methyltransferase